MINNHHLLLVTLLLANAVCIETLPLLLNFIVTEFLAVIISVSFLLIVGEIIPQALCTGPHQLKIASSLCVFVKITIILLLPLAWPISKLLDRIFGAHASPKKLRNKDLKSLITLHHSLAAQNNRRSFSGLNTGQIEIIHGTIDISKKIVKDCMIPAEKVFSLSSETVLDNFTITEIIKQGYSRIPIYEGLNTYKILGIMLMKKLLLIEENVTIRNSGILLREPVEVSPFMPMLDLLAKFKEGKSHIAIVKENILVIGIITLEDLFEEIIQQDIYDEDDWDKEKNFVFNKNIRNKRHAIKNIPGLQSLLN